MRAWLPRRFQSAGSAVNIRASLPDGMRYTVEVPQEVREVRIVESANYPDNPPAWHTVRSGQRIGISTSAGMAIWAWSPDGEEGNLAITPISTT